MTNKLNLFGCATVTVHVRALTPLAMERATLRKIISLAVQEGRNTCMKKCCRAAYGR